VKVVSVLNFKGGTGKSSVVENLAHAVALEGYDVLVLDGDRQRNSTDTLLGNPNITPTLADVMQMKVPLTSAIRQARDHLYVVPSDTDLEKVGTYLKEHRRAYTHVRRELQALGERYALVLIDHAGAYSTVMEALLLASTHMLIPCELEPYSVQGLFDMFAKLQQELEDHELQNAGIIPYNTNYSKKMTQQYIDELREEFGDLVTEPISTDTNVSYAQSNKMTLFEYEKSEKVKSQAAKDFRVLAQRFLPVQQGVQI
jgi:chromosome partitioning protein